MRLGLLWRSRLRRGWRTSAWLHTLALDIRLLRAGLLNALLLNARLRAGWRRCARQRRAAGLTGQRLA